MWINGVIHRMLLVKVLFFLGKRLLTGFRL